MSLLDYLVLAGTMLGIAFYGIWYTRRRNSLESYLRGDEKTGWGTIGLSVMATQASAITFLSTPGQGYESGMAFVQNYFGMPIALVIIAAVFLPIYRRLRVYTAYEYLGRRFDGKTRLLGAGLFLLQRGLAAGITIYAPAIILSTVLGWRLDLTVIVTGLVVILYTVSGGSSAVALTQKYQMAVILVGMIAAFVVLLVKLPGDVSLLDATRIAGGFGKLQAVDFSTDLDRRYTVWTGVLGGVFLSLSYFGTDQSQVQRYLSGGSLRESRLGLMFNAVLKIPMQFFILLLGALVFVFYQFESAPVFFNQSAWARHADSPERGPELRQLAAEYDVAHQQRREHVTGWLHAHDSGDLRLAESEKAAALAAHARGQEVREEVKRILKAEEPRLKTNDSDFVFITFVLQHLPHGLIGLLMAVIFAAALSSISSELNALGTTTAVDLYQHRLRPNATEGEVLKASRWFTLLWGGVALAFALFAKFVSNLIEAVNILGSIFYGVVLGIFLVAFFLKRVQGTAVFFAALLAQGLVIVGYLTWDIGYLWFNLIGCSACVLLSIVIQALRGSETSAAASRP